MKKLFVLFSILFFLGALVYMNVVIFSDNNTSEIERSVEQDQLTAQLKDPMADPDDDGLANWEEDLYGTSKKRSDSDGDGISDGTEVAAGTDPRAFIETPDDTIYVQEDVSKYEFSQNAPDNSISELFNNLQNISINGTETTSTNNQTITGNTGDIAKRQCVNRIATIIDNALVTSTLDLQILQNYMMGSSTNTLPLKNLITANNQAAEDMQIYQNSSDCLFLQKYSTQMINLYKTIGGSLQQILDQGPVVDGYDYEIWNQYGISATAWVTVMNEINIVVASLGIQFAPNEPGSIFTPIF